MSEKTIVESSFIADRDLEPRKAKILSGFKFFWLGISLVGFVATTLEALQ